MRRPMLLAAALTALLLFPAAATAKGPSAATIAGPGLAHAITIEGFRGGRGLLAAWNPRQRDGVLPAGLRRHRRRGGEIPSDGGSLGQGYVVVYTVPGPNGDSTLRQALYPYAVSGPASYMKPARRSGARSRSRAAGIAEAGAEEPCS